MNLTNKLADAVNSLTHPVSNWGDPIIVESDPEDYSGDECL